MLLKLKAAKHIKLIVYVVKCKNNKIKVFVYFVKIKKRSIALSCPFENNAGVT